MEEKILLKQAQGYQCNLRSDIENIINSFNNSIDEKYLKMEIHTFGNEYTCIIQYTKIGLASEKNIIVEDNSDHYKHIYNLLRKRNASGLTLGLKPFKVSLNEGILDILNEMKSYINSGSEIPKDLHSELQSLMSFFYKKNI